MIPNDLNVRMCCIKSIKRQCIYCKEDAHARFSRNKNAMTDLDTSVTLVLREELISKCLTLLFLNLAVDARVRFEPPVGQLNDANSF